MKLYPDGVVGGVIIALDDGSWIRVQDPKDFEGELVYSGEDSEGYEWYPYEKELAEILREAMAFAERHDPEESVEPAALGWKWKDIRALIERALNVLGELMSEESGYQLPERHEAILHLLFEEGGLVKYGKIVRELVAHFDVSPSAVQKDIRSLLNLGLVEKVDKGLYRITKSGMSYLGVRPPGLYYECVESSLLEALKLTQRINDQEVRDELYMKVVDALDCLRDLGRIYQNEWDIEVPLD